MAGFKVCFNFQVRSDCLSPVQGLGISQLLTVPVFDNPFCELFLMWWLLALRFTTELPLWMVKETHLSASSLRYRGSP